MIDFSRIDIGLINLGGWDLGALDLRFVIFVGLFLGVLLTLEGVRQLASRRESRDEATSRRMRLIRGGKTAEEVLAILKPAERSTGFARLPLIGDVPAALAQAGLTIRPAAFFGAILASAGVFAAAGSQVIGVLPSVGVAVLVFVLVPITGVKILRKRRLNRLVAQLPDALELMARGLRVGHPLNTTLAHVANEMPDPIGSEFGIVVDQVAYGDDLAEAMEDMARRIDMEDVHYLSVSVGIQHGTGGDLATILETLARVIRDRSAMRQRIRSISAESRLSAMFLSAIPVFIFVIMSIITPSYFNDVREDPLFIPMMLTIAAFIVVNALLLRKLVKFRF
jgi:tight adherence protein B